MLSKILIVDYGSQLTQLIAKQIRQLNVYSEIYPYDYSFEQLALTSYKGVVLSGGPYDCSTSNAPSIPDIIKELKIPIMGICYGAQRFTYEMGGTLQSCQQKEFGHTVINIIKDNVVFKDVPKSNTVWMSHSDHISTPGDDFHIIALTENNVIAGLAHNTDPIFLLQFHPEATHTEHRQTIFKNFILDICQAEANWDMKHFITDEIQNIKEAVQDSSVLLALSGGVDSLVTAVLLHQAIGKNLHCVLVDHGLLRRNESQEIESFIKENFNFQLHIINAQERFLEKLKGLVDPEDKRKMIGRLFIEEFENFVKTDLTDVTFLAQGTIYSDVIESAQNEFSKAQVIKSHHNVGGLPEKLSLKILEPLRKLFKDEVRKLGIELGIPNHLVYRHPFPGPGMGIRILGEIKLEYLNALQHADSILIEELRKNDLYHTVHQAFCVFLPCQSVGVMGDNRSYDYTIAIRAVCTDNFMTAEFAKLSWDFLTLVSGRITNEVKNINRVVYDISNKPPATIEWE